MLISEMIAMLEEVKFAEGDKEIRIAYQPSFPLSGSVESVKFVEPEYDEDVEDDEGKVWIVMGEVSRRESPYAPRAAFD